MIPFDLLLIIAIFLSSFMAFVAGFVACSILKPQNNILYVKRTGDNTLESLEPATQAYSSGTQIIDKDEPVNPDAAKFSKKDDVINHNGVGIVYRPTGAELDKMNETQAVREAKEEMAKTFESVPPPQI